MTGRSGRILWYKHRMIGWISPLWGSGPAAA
jgi:hypothetical protein